MRKSMRGTWERVRTVPGLFRNIVVILVLIVVGIASGSYMGNQMRFIPPWDDRFVFVAEFENAPATKPEAHHSVTIAGVDVGQIVAWKVSDRGTALLTLDIEAEHRIHDNATAVLRTVNPLNQMFVEINPGGPPGAPLEQDAVLPAGQTERPVQANEVLIHLDDKAQAALTALLRESDVALARAPEQLPGGITEMDRFLQGLQPAVEAVQTRREKLAQVMSAFSQIATAVGGNQERTVRLAEATEQALGVLAENDQELTATLAEMPGLNDQLRRALTATQDLTTQLDPTLENLEAASADLPPALERLTDTAGELREFAEVARPVVAEARPVVADLRPFIADVDVALDDTLPITDRLDRDTAIVVSYLTDLQAFFYNTSSLFSPEDGAGPIIRGHATVPKNPTEGGFRPSRQEAGVPSEGDN